VASRVKAIGKRGLVLAVAAVIAISAGAVGASVGGASSAQPHFQAGFWDGPP
jgi:hypothetical protein